MKSGFACQQNLTASLFGIVHEFRSRATGDADTTDQLFCIASELDEIAATILPRAEGEVSQCFPFG